MVNQLFTLLFCFSVFSIYSQNGQVDLSFNSNDNGLASGDGGNNTIYTSCVLPNGSKYIGGNFGVYNNQVCYNLVRIDSLGNVDTDFNTQNGFNGGVNAILPLPDGRIVVGGNFSWYQGASANNIVCLNPNGTRDNSFNVGTGFSGEVSALKLHPNGWILVGGDFYNYNSNYINGIAKINIYGNIDYSFSSGINNSNQGSVAAIEVQPDGKIIIGGTFTVYEGVQTGNIALINENGTRDVTFSSGVGFNAEIKSIKIRSDGKILVGGYFTTYQGVTANRIVALNSNGTRYNNFSVGTGFFGVVNSIDFGTNNKLTVVGDFTSYKGIPLKRIVELDSLGNITSTFHVNVGPNNIVTSVSKLPNGKSILTGYFNEFGINATNYVCQILENGDLDTTFNKGTGANSYVTTSALQVDGKLILAGNFNGYNGIVKNRIVRTNENGSIDPSFQVGTGLGFQNEVNTILVQSDAKIILGGKINTYNGVTVNNVARLNSNGTIDPSFVAGINPNDNVLSIIQLQSGKYLVSYRAYYVNTYHLIRLNSDGSLDNTFNSGSGPDYAINSMIELPNNQILIGGGFSTYNGMTVNGLARINSSGSLDATFNPGTGSFNGIIQTILIQSDGKIVAGGNFTSLNNINCSNLVRLNSNGSHDASFSASFDNVVESMYQQTNGKLIVTGQFSSVNGFAHPGIARLYSTGELDPTFTEANIFNQNVIIADATNKISANVNEEIFITGSFISINSTGRNRVAKLSNCVAPSGQDVIVACDSYTWINGITYTSSNNTAMFTLMSSQGCDSLIYLDLTINYSTSSTLLKTECNTYTWPHNNVTYTESGYYTDTLLNSVGCDSIVTLELTILHNTFADQFVTECNTYTWPHNNVTYTESGYYTDTLLNSVGCDSIVTLELTILHNTFADQFVTECENYTWSQTGLNYTETGLYVDTIVNSIGCDSVITLHLTILNPTFSYQSAVECNPFTWPQTGLTYSVTGLYYDTLQNSQGCDSIVTLNLTVGNTSYGSENIYSADSVFYWSANNTSYTNSGQYSAILPNASGCDSIITLNLHVFNLSVSTFSTPSMNTNCTGALNIHVKGTADFRLILGLDSINTNTALNFMDSLCPGIYSLLTYDGNNDSIATVIIIPTDSNYVYSNPYLDSIVIDSLSSTNTNCFLNYNTIDTAYIQETYSNGNEITVIWNIVDTTGSHLDTAIYILNNGAGVYYLQLNVYCPGKSLGKFFTVDQTVYFNGQSISLVGLNEVSLLDAAIYPNPTSDNIRIVFNNTFGAAFTLTDIQGKSLLFKHIQSGDEISLENFNAGVYLVKLTSNNKSAVKRIVKY